MSHQHPAVQFEGEVQLCRHQWHKPTADEIEAAIGMCPWCGESLHPGRRCSNEDYMEEQR